MCEWNPTTLTLSGINSTFNYIPRASQRKLINRGGLEGKIRAPRFCRNELKTREFPNGKISVRKKPTPTTGALPPSSCTAPAKRHAPSSWLAELLAKGFKHAKIIGWLFGLSKEIRAFLLVASKNESQNPEVWFRSKQRQLLEISITQFTLNSK